MSTSVWNSPERAFPQLSASIPLVVSSACALVDSSWIKLEPNVSIWTNVLMTVDARVDVRYIFKDNAFREKLL